MLLTLLRVSMILQQGKGVLEDTVREIIPPVTQQFDDFFPLLGGGLRQSEQFMESFCCVSMG